MKKRPLTLIEVLEHRTFQFWFLVVCSLSLFIALRLPQRDEILWLGGFSLLAACGILGVIFLTEHADNPFVKPVFWLKAFASSCVAFSSFALIPPWLDMLQFFLLFLIPVVQGYALSLAFEENLGRCCWWAVGGAGLVIGIIVLGALFNYFIDHFWRLFA